VFSRNGSEVGPAAPVVELLRAAVLASDASIVRSEADGRWHVKGDPTEGALVVAGAKAGMHKADLDAETPRVNEIPFTAETKRMTTLHATPDGPVAYCKGAPEIILGLCERHVTERGEERLDGARRETILRTAHQMASEALRVLAVAAKSNATLETAEHGMTFLGLIGMIDPPRPEARLAVQTCEEAGIKVRMITGDHPLTAQAVARELGILKSGRVVVGTELEAMSDEVLEGAVDDIEIYARVSPVHKLRVVTALQKRGQIVAMTGDGVNDAPALKKADIGIAMGITGTDVTKEASAMTLTDDNFASIVAAVEEGRGLFGNIKKYLMYLLSCNVGEIGLMAGTSLLGLPLPLTAAQLLWVNLATDGLPALALSVDPPESNLMRRPPRNPHSTIFTRPVVTLMTVAGVWTTLVTLGVFAYALRSGRTSTEAMTLTFVALVLIQFFNAYNFRSDRYSVLNHPFANKWLNLAIASQVLLLVVIVYAPPLQSAFNTYGLRPVDWLLVAAPTSTVVPAVEVAKWMQRQGWFGPLD
jgi:Ca2+-transporting ATPase